VGGKWGEATLKYGLLLECGGLTPLSPYGNSRFQSKSDFAAGQSAAKVSALQRSIFVRPDYLLPEGRKKLR
jgi:hypothetical protein